MSLLNLLKAQGVQVFGEPLYTAGAVLATITVGKEAQLQPNTKFEGMQLVIQEDGNTAYINIKNGVATDLPQYKLQAFTALRDWDEYSIKQGQTKVFAVAP